MLKNKPSLITGTVKYRGTTLLCVSLTGNTFQAPISHSDVTVAPVVPTEVKNLGSTHCSQNELQANFSCCLAPTGNSLKPLSALLFLLKRIFYEIMCLCYQFSNAVSSFFFNNFTSTDHSALCITALGVV